MPFGRVTLVGWIVARLARLRFPTLFLVTAVLFVVNLIVPDAIPFVDELLLGVGTALLGSLRTRKVPGAEGTQPPAAAR